ncbi:PadR family transcriptional regulator [Labedella populi]|uniref:PadR family transcriptional regulator n=1 Tax=Labedella populi TaxID=2498850 RepID=A0A444QGB9_9MICO|nr:PadR family transcriptional regulator [Labedella populi]RWZ68558.1 PadR family transcriptional regulator [Labedella populi]
MTVRQSLLAILSIGPCYGYQLRAEFDRRTGSTWGLNVGQTYTTLERLERDGLVRRGDTDTDGHLYWEITDEGRSSASAWLADPTPPARGTRDELAIKVAIAATLPGSDVGAVLRTQRAATQSRLEELRREDEGATGSASALSRRLIRDGLAFDAEAELAWLDHCARVLEETPAQPVPLSTEKPRRGRPAKAGPAPARPAAARPAATRPTTTRPI